MFIRKQSNGSRTYLLIVDNERVDGKVTQRILLRLGRLDRLLANGQLDSLIQQLSRFSEKLSVLGAHVRGDSIAIANTCVREQSSSPLTRSRKKRATTAGGC